MLSAFSDILILLPPPPKRDDKVKQNHGKGWVSEKSFEGSRKYFSQSGPGSLNLHGLPRSQCLAMGWVFIAGCGGESVVWSHELGLYYQPLMRHICFLLSFAFQTGDRYRSHAGLGLLILLLSASCVLGLQGWTTRPDRQRCCQCAGGI